MLKVNFQSQTKARNESWFSLIQADLCKFTNCWPYQSHMLKQLLHPRFAPVLLFRLSSLCQRKGLSFAAKIFALLNQILFGCDIAREASIGGGLFLPHPNGVVVGMYARVGRNCILHQGVTLGARGEEHMLGHPLLGDEVEVATGAKILGDVKLGHYARIGANAVVLRDVPAYSVAVGIPARIVKHRSDAPDVPKPRGFAHLS